MDPNRQETVRQLYTIADTDQAETFIDELVADMVDDAHPVEVQSLGRTLKRWRAQIVAWHRAKVSNGPAEAANNLTKRISESGSGPAPSPTTGEGELTATNVA